MTDVHQETGYVAPPSLPPPPPTIPEVTCDQLKTLRRVQKGSALDRKIWTLLSVSELSRAKLIAPNSLVTERWIVTPLGVEVLERAKGRQV